jgi:hypothetical protein
MASINTNTTRFFFGDPLVRLITDYGTPVAPGTTQIAGSLAAKVCGALPARKG